MESRVILGAQTIGIERVTYRAGQVMSFWPRAGVAPKTVLSNWAAIVALWAPAYLALLDHTGSTVRSEALEWALLAIGACGLASIVYAAWRDTRDPAWRTAHPQLRLWRGRPGARRG